MIEHIKSYILTHGYPPSIRELRDLMGFKSHNSVWRRLRQLEADGLITVEKGQSRAIRLNEYTIFLLTDEQVKFNDDIVWWGGHKDA